MDYKYPRQEPLDVQFVFLLAIGEMVIPLILGIYIGVATGIVTAILWLASNSWLLTQYREIGGFRKKVAVLLSTGLLNAILCAASLAVTNSPPESFSSFTAQSVNLVKLKSVGWIAGVVLVMIILQRMLVLLVAKIFLSRAHK